MRDSGLLIIFAAHSGAGKSTIIRELMGRHPDWLFSVSCTTRAPRTGEKNGREYHFLSVDAFSALMKEGGLLEHEEVHGELYGTPRKPVEEALASERTMILDLDVEGAVRVLDGFTGKTVSFFIDTPNLEILQNRLRLRDTDDDAAVQRRLSRIPREREKMHCFQHIVINDELTAAVDEVDRLILAARENTKRRSG